MKFQKISIFILSILLFSCSSKTKQNESETADIETQSADVIIYGGTSAAVTAAVEVIL